jgi:hypothetical protein
MDKDQIEQRGDGTMGQTAISCTDRKRPSSLPELRLTEGLLGDSYMPTPFEDLVSKLRVANQSLYDTIAVASN